MRVSGYLSIALKAISFAKSVDDLKEWWHEEQKNREQCGIVPGTLVYQIIVDACGKQKSKLTRKHNA